MYPQSTEVQPGRFQSTNDQPAQYDESAYQHYHQSIPEQHAEPAQMAQPDLQQFMPTNVFESQSAAPVHQPAKSGQSSTAKQAAPSMCKAEPADAAFDVDAWLDRLDMGRPASAPPAHLRHRQQSADKARYGTQNGVASTHERYSPDSTKAKYMPPHLRTDSGQVLTDLTASQQQAVQQAVHVCKQGPPPGFTGRLA